MLPLTKQHPVQNLKYNIIQMFFFNSSYSLKCIYFTLQSKAAKEAHDNHLRFCKQVFVSATIIKFWELVRVTASCLSESSLVSFFWLTNVSYIKENTFSGRHAYQAVDHLEIEKLGQHFQLHINLISSWKCTGSFYKWKLELAAC